MALNVKITDKAMRDRLADQLVRLRAQIVEMAANSSGPRSDKSPHLKALVAGARSDCNDLARSIRDWDKAQRSAAQGEAGNRRRKRRATAKGQGGDRVAKRRPDRAAAPVRGD
jgi:hypothetical protein